MTSLNKQIAFDEFAIHRNHILVKELGLSYCKFGEKNPPLLILHTFRSQAEYAYKILDELMKHRTCYLLDLPGHGHSEKNPHLRHDAQFFVDSVIEFIESMGWDKIDVIGESIGGTLVLGLSALIPEKLDMAISFNPHDADGALLGGFLGGPLSFFGKWSTWVTHSENLAILKLVLGGGFVNKENLENEYVRVLLRTPPKESNQARALKSVFKNAHTWAGLRKKLYPQIPSQVNLTLVYGDHDWSPTQLRSQNAKNIAAISQEVILKNTGHFSFQDNPGDVLKVIEQKMSFG